MSGYGGHAVPFYVLTYMTQAFADSSINYIQQPCKFPRCREELAHFPSGQPDTLTNSHNGKLCECTLLLYLVS